MDYFAHIFIGKEFAEIVSKVATQVYTDGGGDYPSSVNLYLLDENRIQKLSYTPDDTPCVSTGEIGVITDNQEKNTQLFETTILNDIMRVGVVGQNAVLRVFIHLPLYKAEALETMKNLYTFISASKRRVEVNIMGYCDDMSRIIEPEYKIVSPAKNQIKAFKVFKESQNIHSNNSHFVAIQDTSTSGIALGLTADTLSSVIAQFAMLGADHYSEIFPNVAEYLDVTAIGLSTLKLDKYLLVTYLLNKSILKAMNNAKVNDTKVNANDAVMNANKVLFDKNMIMAGICAEIDKLNKPNEDEVYNNIRKKYEEEALAIIENSKRILAEHESINMHAAILASCLAKTDCELLEDAVFTRDTITFDRLFEEPISFFIQNDKAEFFQIDEKPLRNPIPLMQELDIKLLNSEEDKRRLEEKLANYEQQINESKSATDCYTQDGFYHYKNQKFRLLPSVAEEPLSETYIPHTVNTTSLDLRSKFSCIKNQGLQGSCLAFSLTSVFEYMMRLNKAEDYDLSEAFLYYNARMMDGTGDVDVSTDNGSRLKPAIDSLKQYGIALEKLWPYKENVYSIKPSDQAYADALTRKLVSAMNVEHKVNDIKSALIDGCPVVASFVLTKSFYEMLNGFLIMPSEEEIDECLSTDNKEEQAKYNSHAMVIVGYSDETRMFLVRNSWGEEWGDAGYCYIPYEYVENERLFNYACIITEVESLTTTKVEFVTPLNIDTNDLTIQYIITKNALNAEEVLLKKLREEKLILHEYFETEKQILSNQNSRDQYIDANREKIEEEKAVLVAQKKSKEDALDANDKEYLSYKKGAYKKIACFTIGILFFFSFVNFIHNTDWYEVNVVKSVAPWILAMGAAGVATYFLRNKTWIFAFWFALIGIPIIYGLKFLGAVAIYLCTKDENSMADELEKIDFDFGIFSYIFMIALGTAYVAYRCYKRHKEWREIRDNITDKINRIDAEIRQKEKEKTLLKLKTFAAWQHIMCVQNLYDQFYAQYTSLIAMINNLRTWYKEFEQSEEACDFEYQVPFVSLLSEEQLDKFFDEKLSKYQELRIDFTNDINKFENAADYKQYIVSKIKDKLNEMRNIADFNVAEHIAKDTYGDYAICPDAKMGNQLTENASVFLSLNPTERGYIEQNTMIFMPSLSQYRDTVSKKLFGAVSHPFHEINNKDKFIVLKTASAYFDECVNFQ